MATAKKEIVPAEDDKLVLTVEKEFKESASSDDVLKELAISSELLPAKRLTGNITEKILSELEKRSSGLTINGLEDKDGFKKVQDLRKLAKKVRVAGVNLTKKGREDAISIQNAWIKVENNFKNRILDNVENPLEKLEDEYLELKEAEDNRRLQLQTSIYTSRVTKLSDLGVLYDSESNTFILGKVSYDGALVREADEDVFEDVYASFKSEHADLHAAEVEAQEEAKKQLERDLRGARETLLSAVNSKIGSETDLGVMPQDEWETLYNAAKVDFEFKKQLEKDKKERNEREVFSKKSELLKGIGFIHDDGNFIFASNGIVKITIPDDQVSATDESSFSALYNNLSKRVVEIQDEAETERRLQKERDDAKLKKDTLHESRLEMLKLIDTSTKEYLGDLDTVEWQRRYAIAKERYDAREAERKDEENKLRSDNFKWKHFVSELGKIKVPEAKGKVFKEKAAAASSLLNQIISL